MILPTSIITIFLVNRIAVPDGNKMVAQREHRNLQLAQILSLLCVGSSAFLVLFGLFGPKTGMEAMIILLFLLFAGAVNLFLGLPALLLAWKSKAHLQCAWIYVYFSIFWGVIGFYLVKVNQVDIYVTRQLDRFTKPAETELTDILHRLYYTMANNQPADPATLDRAKELVDEGTDLSYTRPGDATTMIILAAGGGDAALVRLMIENGADADGSPDSARTPLMVAVQRKNGAVAEVLLESGISPDDPRYRANTPLIVATRNHDTPTAEILLKYGALIDAEPPGGMAALNHAAANGDVPMMKLLLANGADPNKISFGRFSPMYRAVHAECIACVRLLADAGGMPIGKTNKNESIVTWVIRQNQTEIIDIFRAKITSKTWPPDVLGTVDDLIHPIRLQEWDLLRELFSIGLVPDRRNAQGRTALMILAGNRMPRREVDRNAVVTGAQILIDHGADVNARDNRGNTALILASQSGATDLFRLLVAEGADIDAANREGRTALTEAMSKGHGTIVAELITSGADPNATIKIGNFLKNPLSMAVANRDADMVGYLLAAGATIPPEGRSACDLFRKAAPQPEIVRLLAASGVDLNRRDELNRYPLSVVMRHGPPESVAAMIEAGAAPYLEDWRGKQPLMVFVKNGRADMVRLCVEKSDRIRQDPEIMRNAMYWAVRSARVEVVRALLKYGTFFNRMAEVEALLEWAKVPPESPDAKGRILALFRERIGTGADDDGRRSKGSAIMIIGRPKG